MVSLTMMKEAQTGTYKFEDESHIVVRKAISYLYTRSYDEYQGDDDGTSEFSELQLHAQVFAFADRYRIPHLMSYSADKYKARLKLFSTQSLVRVIKKDEGKVRHPILLQGISHNILEFLGSVPAVFNLTPETTDLLRHICVGFAYKKLPLSSMLYEFEDPYNKTLLEAPGFAKQLLDTFFMNSLGPFWHYDPSLKEEPDQEFDPSYEEDEN
ncbi:hypothetical protein N7488_004131 [Penicillium malachiteum]|nr:hypothetical protein N7488_004131 [Penicillium malachiteum]